jgi:hypothetical protein
MELEMITIAVKTNSIEATDSVAAFAEVDALAWQIDRDGFKCVPTEAIDHVLVMARSTKSSPVLAGVLADVQAPSVVRERAFGLLAMQILSTIDRSRVTLAA